MQGVCAGSVADEQHSIAHKDPSLGLRGSVIRCIVKIGISLLANDIQGYEIMVVTDNHIGAGVTVGVERGEFELVRHSILLATIGE